MTTLAPSYDPKTFEARIYAEWETSGVFEPRGDGPAYTILLPPPNVTGTLHMGHAFQHTLQDALIRYHRMRGYRTLWQMGTDHAGIATEMVVARNLARDGLTRDDLGRDKFIEKVWEWKGESGDTIERQMRRLGTSGDWTRKVFTMDESASEAVVEAFVRLHDDDLIYRGQRLVNWDPVLKTAISDLEVISEEEDGFLWSISYPLSDGSGSLVVATTRPETMLVDTAVMVHPEDERYKHLIGKSVTLPLVDREIPIIADDYVDREFGTGVVKVTPAHDFNDYAVWKRHVDSGKFDKVPNRGLINIFSPAARIIHDPHGWAIGDGYSVRNIFHEGPSDTAADLAKSPFEALEDGLKAHDVLASIPKKYQDLDRYEARKKILDDLEEIGLLIETKHHKLLVPRGDRSGQVIEPYLTNQWFVSMDELAERGLKIFEDGNIRFVPSNWINTYRHWMENIQDWCISRQLWWGHRIPAWYDEQGNVYVARNEGDALAQAAAKSGGPRPTLRQDNDVLETWFSSGIWPISTMGWPEAEAMRERGFEQYVPSNVLVTGFDIIFFWVARMIVMTDRLAQQVPFKDVYITGLVRDKEGQKMSKSKGNILDPLDIIDGITLDDLIAKRTTGLMQPKMADKIEKATRKEFPDGIQAFGADPLRFTMAALAGPGRDIKFDLHRAEGYKNFCNKLWNASRFVLMNCEEFYTESPIVEGEWYAPKTEAERWILARFSQLTRQVERQFAAYRFDLVAQAIYEFAWNDFCDWFLELTKPALLGNDKEAADSTRRTLLFVLESLLRLLHPLIPFVTEEIWRNVKPHLKIDGDTISTQPYPQPENYKLFFATAEADIEWLKLMVSALRRVRSELGVSPAKAVSLLLQGGTDNDRARTERFASRLKFLNKIDAIAWLDDAPPPAATAVVGDLTLFVPLEGLVDLDAERTRLDKELKRIDGELAKSRGKLASETFVQNAPAAVVEQERQRLIDWTAQRDALAGQRAHL